MLTTSFSMNWLGCPGSDRGVPVVSGDTSLSPPAFVATTRTVYWVLFVSPVIVCLYLLVESVDEPLTRLVEGSTDA